MNNITYTMAFWLLRIWLGMRALFTGITKFQGMNNVPKEEFKDTPVEDLEIFAQAGTDVYDSALGIAFQHYEALPEKGMMSIESFVASPLMPECMVRPYAGVLGFALIGLGLTVLAGVCTRVSLFLMGLLYISLTYGFIILEPTMGPASAAGIAYLGIHMLMVIAALLLADYNKFELLPCKKLCRKCNCKNK